MFWKVPKNKYWSSPYLANSTLLNRTKGDPVHGHPCCPHFSATFFSPSGIKCHSDKRVAAAPPRTRQVAHLHSLNPPGRAARKAERASKNRKELKKVKEQLPSPAGGTPEPSSRPMRCKLNRWNSQCWSLNYFDQLQVISIGKNQSDYFDNQSTQVPLTVVAKHVTKLRDFP